MMAAGRMVLVGKPAQSMASAPGTAGGAKYAAGCISAVHRALAWHSQHHRLVPWISRVIS